MNSAEHKNKYYPFYTNFSTSEDKPADNHLWAREWVFISCQSWHLDLGLPILQKCEKWILLFTSYPVCGTWFWRPQQMNRLPQRCSPDPHPQGMTLGAPFLHGAFHNDDILFICVSVWLIAIALSRRWALWGYRGVCHGLHQDLAQ